MIFFEVKTICVVVSHHKKICSRSIVSWKHLDKRKLSLSYAALKPFRSLWNYTLWCRSWENIQRICLRSPGKRMTAFRWWRSGWCLVWVRSLSIWHFEVAVPKAAFAIFHEILLVCGVASRKNVQHLFGFDSVHVEDT